MHILFCNIAYMQYYDYELIEENPHHGGKYVEVTGDALEKNNFHRCEDGKLRGFVETKYKDSFVSQKEPKNLRIENISSNYKKQDSIDGVTVVFCAHSDKHKKSVIVGWYKNATVYRKREHYKGRQYNLMCDFEDGYLIDEQSRTFKVPRASVDGFGFGQANVWYAKEKVASNYVQEVAEYIDSLDIQHNDDTMPQIIPQIFEESGIAKKVVVNKYERNVLARRKCIELKGSKCEICGFNSALFYGDEFKEKIEVHHIVPINQIKEDYQVNPETDLIPVCPNCHMILHIKMNNGQYPSIEMLKEKFKK